MKNLVIMMTAIGMGFSACNTAKNNESHANREIEQSTSKEAEVAGKEHIFTLENETVKIQSSEDGMNVISGTYQVGNETAQPINITNMKLEGENEENVFFGEATSAGWEGTMDIAIMSDFSKLSLIGDNDIKKFTRK